MNAIAEAYIAACKLELDALKPGNIHRYADGHGMTVEDFEISAEVSAPAVAREGARVGARIHDAVTATRRAVGQNTNLGIVLLCAPLAAAAERPGDLAPNVERVLDALTLEDTQLCFAAIATANPGGLGSAARYDVKTTPSVSLRAAMAEAAARDLVARQYANGFADIFGFGFDAWRAAGANGLEPAIAASHLYLAFLRTCPDTHVARKFGLEAAETVWREAVARSPSGVGSTWNTELIAWDADLKARGLNPGACADLTVATIFAAFLLARVANDLRVFSNND